MKRLPLRLAGRNAKLWRHDTEIGPLWLVTGGYTPQLSSRVIGARKCKWLNGERVAVEYSCVSRLISDGRKVREKGIDRPDVELSASTGRKCEETHLPFLHLPAEDLR